MDGYKTDPSYYCDLAGMCIFRNSYCIGNRQERGTGNMSMKRILVIASHEKMADGMKDTLNFISGGIQETIALSAYVDNRSAEETIEEVMDGFEEEDEVVVLTDLMAGSVNQKFFKYRTRPHTHIVSGMNLPLAFQIAMEPQGEYITEERMKEMIEAAREEMKYINEIADDEDEEDE